MNFFTLLRPIPDLFFHFLYVWLYKKCICRTYSRSLANPKGKYQVYDLYNWYNRDRWYISCDSRIRDTRTHDSYSKPISTHSSNQYNCFWWRLCYKGRPWKTRKLCKRTKKSKWINCIWEDSYWYAFYKWCYQIRKWSIIFFFFYFLISHFPIYVWFF